MDLFNFLVAHPAPGADVDLLNVFTDVRRWMSSFGEIERCGGRAGKVISFNEKKFLADLSQGKLEAIELYSARKWPKDDVSEMLNADCSVIFTDGVGLMLCAHESQAGLVEIADALLMMESIAGICDYAYGYTESRAYGTGYARGIFMPDEAHPLMWPRRSEACNWERKRWASETDAFLRDVFPVNLFSALKIAALPLEKRQALESAMGAFGTYRRQGELTVWTLDGQALASARVKLLGVGAIVA
ncbi:hypothetical protein [Pseudomonas sp. NPDC089401]|uniref:hypothetical protein n=1 Tax=Pseudomonas sp. NPDC089401 TaxID=3364462 RepID=UPI00380BF8C8